MTDANEVYYHKLEALQVHLFFTRGLGEDSTMADGAARSAPSAYTSGGTGGGGDADEYSSLKPMQRKVLLWIKENARTDDGVLITDIAMGVKGDGVTAAGIS